MPRIQGMKMKKRIVNIFCGGFVALGLFLTLNAADAEELMIIANPGVAGESVAWYTVAEIYSNMKATWENGDQVRVVMLKTGTTHALFVRTIVKTTPEKLNTLWKKVIYTGVGRVPKIVKQETEMVAFVAKTPGAIGYIDAATPHDGVKVLALTK